MADEVSKTISYDRPSSIHSGILLNPLRDMRMVSNYSCSSSLKPVLSLICIALVKHKKILPPMRRDYNRVIDTSKSSDQAADEVSIITFKNKL